MPEPQIQWYKGMPYGEFQRMMEQRRGVTTDVVSAPCTHPFEDVRRTLTAKRGVEKIYLLVEYHCTACDTELGKDSRVIRFSKALSQ